MDKNEIAEVLFTREQIAEYVRGLANRIEKDYKDRTQELMVVCILKGSLIFTADLIREIHLPMSIEFMKVSSYGAGTSSTGLVNILLDIKRESLSDVDILIVEDIIDSGRTLSALSSHFRGRGAASVKCCTLLDKPARREVKFEADYVGAEIPDKFVVGYGLDYNEQYRNLPFVGVLSPSVYSV